MVTKNIVLVGFMGTGKSAVGRLLAKRLDQPFVDLDERISRQAGRTLPEIFQSEGEPAFRKREREAVRWASGLKGHVIATGGGVMLDGSNVRDLKRFGWLVCLMARPEVILERTFSSLPSRPLLKGSNPRQKVEELLQLRQLHYAQADVAIDTSDRSIQEVVKEILKRIEELVNG